MAVLVLFHGVGIKKADYETLRREVGWERHHAKGGIFHAAGFDEHGDVHVTDVWESQEHLDAFVGMRLMPVMQKHNMTPPKVSVFPAHNINALPAVEEFILR